MGNLTDIYIYIYIDIHNFLPRTKKLSLTCTGDEEIEAQTWIEKPSWLVKASCIFRNQVHRNLLIFAVSVHVCSKISFEWIYLAYIPKYVLKKS